MTPMAGLFSFPCATCGEIHEGSPSFAFRAPDPYLEQPPEVQAKGMLSDDLCQYEDADGMRYFIRVCLEIPIHGIAEPFLWGVWVSVSANSFHRYVETYDAPDTEDCYFGWLCNALPGYPDTYALKTQGHPRSGNIRPYIVLEETGHPLSVDFYQGIRIDKARAIAEHIHHPNHP